MSIGVLALQGDFADHAKILKKLKTKVREVRTKEDLDKVAGLIIPGGESTTIGKLLKKYDLDKEIKKRSKKGMPIYGTCAGAILLAKEIKNSDQPSLGLIDITIERNAYGRQIDSFEENIQIKGMKKTFSRDLHQSTNNQKNRRTRRSSCNTQQASSLNQRKQYYHLHFSPRND